MTDLVDSQNIGMHFVSLNAKTPKNKTEPKGLNILSVMYPPDHCLSLSETSDL